jgi:TonB family protein
MLRLVTAAALIMTPSASGAAPLQPTGKWEVQYSDVACTAKRSFGDFTLEYQPSPFGKTARLVIEGPGRISRDRQYNALIALASGETIRASSLLYPAREKNRRGLFLILSAQEAQRAMQGPTLELMAGAKLIKKADGLPNTPAQMSAEFALGSTTSLAKTLATCIKDLRKHWDIRDDKPVADFAPARLIPGRRGIFTSDDYPADAMANDQTGTTRYLLMIDETGRVLDCVVDESSGVASLDVMGCQAMLQRAKFEPPLDDLGKPTKEIQQFRLSWQIRG